MQSVKDLNNSSYDQYVNLSYVSLAKDNKAASKNQNQKWFIWYFYIYL